MNLDLTNVMLFAAVVMAVYAVASFFEKTTPTVTVGSIRRAEPSGWLAQILNRFQHEDATTKRKDETRLMLLQAGYEAPDAAQTYQATRAALALGLPALLMALVPLINLSSGGILLGAVIACLLGYLLPQMYVRSRRARRQQTIREGLPDILDLLLVTTEAGLGLDTAVLRVGEETSTIHPVIAKLFLQMSAELRAGRPRADSFQTFSDRCGIQETTSMVNLLVQSDRLGTSMATALRTFSEDMRAHRLLKAEEIGQKIGVKLSGVLGSCFLPALLITIGAPVLINVITKIPLHR
jgi:tight adherence protein C